MKSRKIIIMMIVHNIPSASRRQVSFYERIKLFLLNEFCSLSLNMVILHC